MISDTTQAQSRKHLSFPVLEKFFDDAGSLARFAVHFFAHVIRPPYEFAEFLKQEYATYSKIATERNIKMNE